ncbi:MAG: Mth938-like domain-containing protein [Chloroflexi bacterium]|nr:Mth938-like domain-containing protein [Chloroflexota bacterium]
MPLAEAQITSRYSIQGYDPGQIVINEQIHRESLVLSADQLISPWPVHAVDELHPDNLACIYALKPDVILLGTGEKQVFPSIDILGYFARQGVGVEVMNTGALCRTFNILIAEDRQVVAAVIQPKI